MKQKKGKDHKMTRQWTDENRVGIKRLKKSVKPSIIRGEFDVDKFNTTPPAKEDSNEN